jgi:biopolymer transport protein ExbD
MTNTDTKTGSPSLADLEASRRADRKALQKLRSRIDQEDVSYLNITAMMDMMTILLVFQIMQFANETAAVQQSKELSLAASTTSTEMKESVPVTITTSAILVDGKKVVDVHAGSVDASQKTSGATTGMVIKPLLDALKERALLDKKIAELKGTVPEGAVTVIAHKTTPYRLLTEVLYTAGDAEYKMYRLIVTQKGK